MIAEVRGGSVLFRVAPGSLPATDQMTGYWGGTGPKTISGTAQAPAAWGPVNGCLKYQATFDLFAYAGNVIYSSSGKVRMVDSIAVPHSHTITGPNYCVGR
jgi:hypothetical protein